MSIFAVAREYVDRRPPILSAREQGADGDAPSKADHANKAASEVGSRLHEITKYIPGEIVGAYVPVVEFLGGNTGALWITFWVFLLLTIGVQFTAVAFEDAKKGSTSLRFPVFPIFAALLAFWAWSIAVPGSVWVAKFNLPSGSGLIAVILSLIIIAMASKWDYILSKRRRAHV